jgi:hypothetical protein
MSRTPLLDIVLNTNVCVNALTLVSHEKVSLTLSILLSHITTTQFLVHMHVEKLVE